MGIVGRSPATTLGCDEDSKHWCVVYACRKKMLGLKNEWIWIYSRKPKLSEEHLAEAMAAIKEFLPDFDEDRLVPVRQGEEEGCEYPDF